MIRTMAAPLRASLCLALSVPLLASTPAAAAPVLASGALARPTPSLACAKHTARPRTGRGLLIAGGILAGLGLVPTISGVYTRVKYGPCGSSGGLCLDGTG